MLVNKRAEKQQEINTSRQQTEVNINKQVDNAPELMSHAEKKIKLDAENIMEEKQVEELVKDGGFLDSNIEQAEDAVDVEKEKVLSARDMERLSITGRDALKNEQQLVENIKVVGEDILEERQAENQVEEQRQNQRLVPDLREFKKCLTELQRETGNRSESFKNVKDTLSEFIGLAESEETDAKTIAESLLRLRKAGVAYYNSHRGHRSWLFGGHRRKETIENVVKACEDYILSDGMELSMRMHILKDIKNDPEEKGVKDVKKKKFFDRAAKQLSPYHKDRFDDTSFSFYIDVMAERSTNQAGTIAMEKSMNQGQRADSGFSEFGRMGFLVKDYIRVNGAPVSEEGNDTLRQNIDIYNKFYSNNIEDRKDLVNMVLDSVLEFEFKPEMLTLEYIREHFAELNTVGIHLANFENVIYKDPLNYAAFISMPEEVRDFALKKAEMLNELSFVAQSVLGMHNISLTSRSGFAEDYFCHPISKVKTPDWLKSLLKDFKGGIQKLELDHGEFLSNEEIGLEDLDYSYGDGKDFYTVEKLENGNTKIVGQNMSYWSALVGELNLLKKNIGSFDKLSGKIDVSNWKDGSTVSEDLIKHPLSNVSKKELETATVKYNEVSGAMLNGLAPGINDLRKRAEALKNNGRAASALIDALTKICERTAVIAGIDANAGHDDVLIQKLNAEADRLDRQYAALYRTIEALMTDETYEYKNVDQNAEILTPREVRFRQFKERLIASENPADTEAARAEAEARGPEELADYDRKTEMFRADFDNIARELFAAAPDIKFREARNGYIIKKSNENLHKILSDDEKAEMAKKYTSFNNSGNVNRVFECRFKSVYFNENGEPATEMDRENLKYAKDIMNTYLTGTVADQERTLDDIKDFYMGNEIPFEKMFDMDFVARHFCDEWYLRLKRYGLTTDQVNKFEHHAGFFSREKLEQRYGKDVAEKFQRRTSAVTSLSGLINIYMANKIGIGEKGEALRINQTSLETGESVYELIKSQKAELMAQFYG